MICCVLAFTACGKDHGAVPATATPTETVSQTSIRSPSPLTPATEAITYPAACEINDPTFCEFAKAVDEALRRGDVDFIVAHTQVQSLTCTDNDTYGPCPHLELGTILRGYYVGAAHTDGGFYYSENKYRSLLASVANIDTRARDDYGDGTWRLAGVFDYGQGTKTLASTTIGPDPWYEDATNKRRAFTWLASYRSGEWGLDDFLTYVIGLTKEPLDGVTFGGGTRIEGWARWAAQ